MNIKKKVGIIDSGIGGLSILFHLLKMQHNCDYYYQSDHSNVPYGNKKQEFMFSQTAKMVEKLIVEKVDLILIACNTLTAETIDRLRQEYQIPFVGIEPYINYINLLNAGDRAGLILTEATFNSSRFKELRAKYDTDNKLEIFPLKNLALIIEEMQYKSIKNGLNLVDKELSAIKNYQLDTLLLGCTHYPLIGKYISRSLQTNVLDPHLAVCKRVLSLLHLDVVHSNDFLQAPFFYSSEIVDDFKITSLKEFSFFQDENGF